MRRIFCSIENHFEHHPILYCWNFSARRTSVISHRTPGDGHKIDAVSIAFPVRKVVAEVGSRKTHRLTILEAPDILPDHLLISEAWPTVRLGLLQEFFHRSPTRRNKERLSRNRIKICGFTFSVHFGQEVSRLPIPSILSIVPVEGADLVCGLKSREIRSIGQCTCQRSTNFVGAKT